jgi:hypothetical protein
MGVDQMRCLYDTAGLEREVCCAVWGNAAACGTAHVLTRENEEGMMLKGYHVDYTDSSTGGSIVSR